MALLPEHAFQAGAIKGNCTTKNLLVAKAMTGQVARQARRR
jgi:hypothetical protein